jgi:hypothetical protein
MFPLQRTGTHLVDIIKAKRYLLDSYGFLERKKYCQFLLVIDDPIRQSRHLLLLGECPCVAMVYKLFYKC